MLYFHAGFSVVGFMQFVDIMIYLSRYLLTYDWSPAWVFAGKKPCCFCLQNLLFLFPLHLKLPLLVTISTLLQNNWQHISIKTTGTALFCIGYV